jgi:hypothetical protein
MRASDVQASLGLPGQYSNMTVGDAVCADKTKESYLGFVSSASALLWLPFVHKAWRNSDDLRCKHFTCGRRSRLHP